jgi:iron complex outermembrane receptor protein
VGAPSYPGYYSGHGNYVFPGADCAYNYTTKTYTNGGSAALCAATGNAMANAPDFTLNLTLNHKMELAGGKLDTNITWSYNNGYYYEVDNRTRQAPFGLLNAQLMWTCASGKYNIRVWGRNLTDKHYYSEYDEDGVGDLASTGAAPRTYGVSFGVNF